MTTQQGSFASRQKFIQAVAFSVFILAVALSLVYTGYLTLYQTYLYLAYAFLALLAVLWLVEVFTFAAKLKPTNDAGENTTAVHGLPVRFKLAVALNIATLAALVAYCAFVAADTTLQLSAYFPYLFTAFMMAFLTSFVVLMFIASREIPNQKRKGTP